MKYDGRLFISARYTKQKFVDLNLSMCSKEEKWEEAIEIFEDRIRGRYLNVIREMINNKNTHIDGFCIMALNCLLIETLLQFKYGWSETKRANCFHYSDFLYKEFRDIFYRRSLAETFYKDIRCGILHSAETKNGSQLTIEQYDPILMLNKEGAISVDVIRIYEALEEYFNNYIKKLKDKESSNERKCFLKKMMYICRN